jgi:hypothetical protein
MRVIFLIIISVNLSLAVDVLIDKKTGLMWQDNSTVKYIKKDWQGALDFCDKLQLESKGDWRLPSIKELINVVNLSEANLAIKNGFKNLGGSGYYWSASAHESNEEFAWMMNFKRGYEYINYKTYERYVRCVRAK